METKLLELSVSELLEKFGAGEHKLGPGILPYGKIARTAEEAHHAVKAQLMFVSHDGTVSSRSTGDWLIHDFVKMTGEFLTEFESANH